MSPLYLACCSPTRCSSNPSPRPNPSPNPNPNPNRNPDPNPNQETLVAPLRGLMPRMTLSTPLANCYPPSILSIVALPVNESGNLAQFGWDAAVRATV